jgi:hypothetical protein
VIGGGVVVMVLVEAGRVVVMVEVEVCVDGSVMV